MTSIALMTQNVQEQHTVPIEQYLELKQQLTLAHIHIEWQDERFKAVEQDNCTLREQIAELEEKYEYEPHKGLSTDAETTELPTHQTSTRDCRGTSRNTEGTYSELQRTSQERGGDHQELRSTSRKPQEVSRKPRQNAQKSTRDSEWTQTTLSRSQGIPRTLSEVAIGLTFLLTDALAERDETIEELQKDKVTLLEREERNEARIHEYEMDKRYENALLRVEGKHLNGVDKQILLTLRNYNRKTSNDPHAMNRVCIGVLAQCVGGSSSNVSRRIDDLVAHGFLAKNFIGPTPKDPNSHIDIALPAILDDPTDIKRATDQERKQGGARPCKKCGSELADKYSLHVCRNCKDVTINNLPGTITPYEQQKAFKVVMVDQEEQTPTNESQDNTIEVAELHHDEISQQANTNTNELYHDVIIQKQVAPLAVINALVNLMSNYKVEYHPQRTCSCGCQLWRKVFGELECCQCEPAPLWPEQYNRAIKALYAEQRRETSGTFQQNLSSNFHLHSYSK